jgi:ABC-2 type transport system permease protein
MSRLFRAELLRVFSGRLLLGLLATAAGLTALSALGNSRAALDAVQAGTQTEATAAYDLLRLGFSALLFSTLYGALLVTSEFRHGSITRTVFVAGRAERVMVAKLFVSLPAGVAFGLAGAGSALLTTWAAYAASGRTLVLDGESAAILAGVFAVSVLAAPWGVLLGWILRSQIAAIAGVMVWTLIVESAITALAPSVGRFLPGGAQSSIYRDFDVGDPLSTPLGYLLFAGWLAAAAAVAVTLVRRRDLV